MKNKEVAVCSLWYLNNLQSFTYLNMADKRGPWYKEDGQQDNGLTADDLLEGRRVSATPKKDPRFPDYYKRSAGRN